jgi:hypothetical protein
MTLIKPSKAFSLKYACWAWTSGLGIFLAVIIKKVMPHIKLFRAQNQPRAHSQLFYYEAL